MKNTLQIMLTSILFLISATGTLNAQTPPPYKTWKTSKNKLHPLVGKIWSTGDKKFITREDLISRLAIRDYILLGETHDNADHHSLQAWVINKVVRYDRKPAIVMEMIDIDQQEELKLFMASVKEKKQPQPATNLGAALKWEERGWPSWQIYLPIAKTIFSHRLPLYPGNPTKDSVKNVARKSIKFIGNDLQKQYRLDKTLPFTSLSALKNIINKGHCNLLPYAALAPMVDAQRYKDAVLADNLIKGARFRGGVLIAGSGHIRKDWGVPHYLKLRDPEASVISLAMTEVKPGKNLPSDHFPVTEKSKPAVDYVWFTPRQERKDPCVELKKKLKGGAKK